jgi:hypothetical protein
MSPKKAAKLRRYLRGKSYDEAQEPMGLREGPHRSRAIRTRYTSSYAPRTRMLSAGPHLLEAPHPRPASASAAELAAKQVREKQTVKVEGTRKRTGPSHFPFSKEITRRNPMIEIERNGPNNLAKKLGVGQGAAAMRSTSRPSQLRTALLAERRGRTAQSNADAGPARPSLRESIDAAIEKPSRGRADRDPPRIAAGIAKLRS